MRKGDIMERRKFLKACFAGGVAAGLPGGQLFAAAGAKQPNIIFILADDMGWSDIGCFGGEIATPNLDRLAAGGIRFTQIHNTAKCFPSRACLLTGLYAQQCGMARGPSAFKNAVTTGEVLRGAGYRTLWTGKHHGTDNPFDRGFDRYRGMRDGAGNYFNPGLQRPGEKMPAQKRYGKRVWCFDEKVLAPFTPQEKDFYVTDYYTNWALEFLDQYKAEDKPYFLYIAHQAPHDPLQAWPEDIAKYEGKYKAGYEAIAKARYARQRKMKLLDDTFPRSAPTHKAWDSLSDEKKKDQARRMTVYAAMIDRMDQNIGRVLAKVKELGEEENTLIFFASDNGCSAENVQIGKGEIGAIDRWSSLQKDWANVSNTPFRFFKNYSHEGGICTPLIAYWPRGIKGAGRISQHAGHFIDIMATLIDVSGAKYPGEHNGQPVWPYEGESLRPVFEGDETPRRKPLFWQWSKGKAVLKGKWKLVSWNKKWELFDMEKDKTETNDLSGKHPEIVAELQALHEQWAANCAGEVKG
jgi:arylsulfatase A-like enzyme